jgi:Ras-related protein Rab-28
MEDWHELVIKTFKDREMPLMILLGNKVDLNHMQAVKQDVHTKFAEKNNMNAYYVSAKSGDQVSTVFYQLAADLAGITLTKPSLEIATKKVKAEIMKHTDDEHNAGGPASQQSK